MLFLFLFDESLRIPAAVAEVLGCLSASEAFDDCLRSVGAEDGMDVLLENIAEVDHALAVKTAGNHRAVDENAELILEPIAEEFAPLDLCVPVGPLKSLSPLKIDAVADSGSAVAFLPLPGDAILQVGDCYLIAVVVKAKVPKTEDHDGADVGCPLGKVCKAANVLRVRVISALLKAVEGDVDLVHADREKLLGAALEKRAVGGDDRLISPLARHANEFGEQRVCQRLPHEVVVKILGLIGQLSENMSKFLLGHATMRAAMAVTEGATHVASVRDLDIRLVVHDCSFHTEVDFCPVFFG